MKKMVTDSMKVVSRYETYSRDELINLLDSEISNLPEDQRGSVKFEIDDYGYAYDDTTYFALFMKWARPETDEEEQKREAEDAARKEQQLKRDREAYERLKSQFGD